MLRRIEQRLDSLFRDRTSTTPLDIKNVSEYKKTNKIDGIPQELLIMENVPCETCLGWNPGYYGHLALFVVEDFISSKIDHANMDYKCYSMNLGHPGGDSIYPGNDDRDDCKYLKSGIESWIAKVMCDWEKRKTAFRKKQFRRTLIIKFVSRFLTTETPEDGGHAIALGAISTETGLKLIVFDRVERYQYAVHTTLLAWMREAATVSAEYQNKGDKPTIETQVVRPDLTWDRHFMMCMSVAFRVCMYMAIVKNPTTDIKETDEDFKIDSDIFKSRVFRMMNYLHARKDIQSNDLTPISSTDMANVICELNKTSCVLTLVSTDVLKRYENQEVHCPRDFATCMESHTDLERLVYDKEEGLRKLETQLYE